MFRYRVRPSKPASVLAMVVGGGFVLIGVAMVIPMFGAFGILWTLVAAGIAVFHGVNVFSDAGVAHSEVLIDTDAPPSDSMSFDERLRRLQQLQDDGLISTSEYERKREELLAERW